MKIIAPEYYKDFMCTADRCRHTCCEGWEIDIDEESLAKFSNHSDIMLHVSTDEPPHIVLDSNERCPFLDENNLCSMILTHGEDILCGICHDHPRFRNYWTDRTEIGLGLVCEEAARLILSNDCPMKLIVLEDDGNDEPLPDDEKWLLEYRNMLLSTINESGPPARLREYLIYRHIPDALYDGLLEERTAFINKVYSEIMQKWSETDGTVESLTECARQFSYDVEYDDEIFKNYINDTDKV